MKILLVQPELNFGHHMPEAPSMALLNLATLAEGKGHSVKILHQANGSFPDELNAFKPDIVGITCNTFQVKSARAIAEYAKAYDTRVVLGGPHAPAWNGLAPVDDIVIGEGENKWLEILGEKPDIHTVNDIPLPNYDLIDFDKFSGINPVGNPPAAALMASRGCPYQCTFCNTPVFWGKKVRYRDPTKVVDEVQLLHEKYGINEIFFQDDTFNINHPWAYEIFLGIIKRGLNDEMLFKIDCRVNEKLLTKPFLELAYKAGVWNIFYGIESGSQVMLDRMKKGITIAEIKRAVKMTHDAGINTQCSFIVGMPGETMRTLAETGNLIREMNPTTYGWVFGCPFPNTELDREVTAKGHKRGIPYSEYGYGKVICRTDELDYPELEAFQGFGV